MKSLLFIISVLSLFISNNTCGQGKQKVTEIYYQISDSGEINKKIEKSVRQLTFKKDKGLINTEHIKGDEINEIFNGMVENSEKVYDEDKRVVECTKQSDNITSVTYYIKYNNYDDPEEMKIIEKNNGKQSGTSIMIFEYFYICDISFGDKDKEVSDKTMKNYYRMGLIPSEKGCPWFLRTVKKDGKTIEFTERKYKNENTDINNRLLVFNSIVFTTSKFNRYG